MALMSDSVMPEWLRTFASLAKNQDTRHLALEEPAVVSKLISFVESARSIALEGAAEGYGWGEDNVVADAPSEGPSQISNALVDTLAAAFSALRNSCAACRQNQDFLRGTGLAIAASERESRDGEYLAKLLCSGTLQLTAKRQLQHPPPCLALKCAILLANPGGLSADSVIHQVGSPASPTAGAGAAASPTGSTRDNRRALRMALQFLCNFCAGNSLNQASLWAIGFSRGFMELVNGLKTDRQMLGLAVALIHNCCPASSGGERGRIHELISDRAFCCMLMKVVVPYAPTGATPAKATGASEAKAEVEGVADKDDDPAAEWLYLLFTRFAQEYLLSDLYDAVGVRTRPNDPRDGVAGGISRTWEAIIADAGPMGNGVDVGGAKPGGAGVVDDDTNDPDAGESFSEVTPEQLIVLNLAEIAAADRESTGGDLPTLEQQQICEGIAAWLVELLASMPLDQNLTPQGSMGLVSSGDRSGCARVPEAEGDVRDGGDSSTTRRPSPAAVSGGPHDGGIGIRGEAERTRRRMREECRSAILRALAALLASCGKQTRVYVVGLCARMPLPSRAENTDRSPANGLTSESSIAVPVGQTGILVPLCLRLLSLCGGRARVASKKAMAATLGLARGEDAGTEEPNMGEPSGVPAGRKAELLQVIANACFRCLNAQEAVRDFGGLNLILNHCGIDDANPLLREYALLAVRNLCEGNIGNQTAIAALQPQGRSPGTDEALAELDLEAQTS